MAWRHLKLIAVVILIGIILCAATDAKKGKEKGERSSLAKTSKAGEIERKVTEAEVPKAALAALKKMAGGTEITEFAEEIEHGSTFYEGSWKSPSGTNMDVLVTPAGDLVEIEQEVGADDVPSAVLKVARKAAGKNAQLAFEKKTMILYEAKFRKGELRHEVLLTPDGHRVKEEIEKGEQDDDEDEDDEDEEEVSLDEVPKAVRATILKEANGAKIEEVVKEIEDGQTIYEAEFVVNGQEVEIEVAPDGTLLEREIEEDDD